MGDDVLIAREVNFVYYAAARDMPSACTKWRVGCVTNAVNSLFSR